MPGSDYVMEPYLGPWTDKQLRHLLKRTLFGISPADYEFFKGKGMNECIETLLRTIPVPPPPVFHDKDDPPALAGSSFVFFSENKKRNEDWTVALKAYWVGLMINSQRSITGKMVLFWHNHFVVEFNTVNDARYEYNYVNVLTKHALGNFKKMLKEITVSPAMLVYLNGNLNNKTTSNENYGRELQELFTIGKGPDSHYTESDVKAAAKVLTGWKDDKSNIDSFFEPSSHNTGDKVFSAFYNNHVIVGKSGSAGAEETDSMIDMICSNREVSKFLCRKLYRWFVQSAIDEQVEKEVIAPLSIILIESNYEVKPVLKALFGSSFFYKPELTGAMVKSPADYFIGMFRELDVRINKIMVYGQASYYEGWLLLQNAIAESGQDIGDPPSVAGWPACYEFPLYDKNWINSEYLSARNRWLRVFSYYEGFNPQAHPIIDFDFTGFVKHLPSPQNPAAVVTDTLKVLCSIQPGKSQCTNLQNLLGAGQKMAFSWQELWSKYLNDPNDKNLKDEVFNRLRTVFNVILMLPEYQIF